MAGYIWSSSHCIAAKTQLMKLRLKVFLIWIFHRRFSSFHTYREKMYFEISFSMRMNQNYCSSINVHTFSLLDPNENEMYDYKIVLVGHSTK